MLQEDEEARNPVSSVISWNKTIDIVVLSLIGRKIRIVETTMRVKQ